MSIKKQKPMRRGAGILLPVTSLPSPYGVGTFGAAAYRFVDFLKAAGQAYWQVLPLGPTSYGDSPYQSFSAFAGNPYLIDLDLLAGEGLLTAEELQKAACGTQTQVVDYALLYKARFPILRQAFLRSEHRKTEKYLRFQEESAPWLEDYSLYMALKNHFEDQEWLAWPEEIRLRQGAAVEKYRALLAEEQEFWRFCQYKFFEQWDNLKSYANRNGIEMIGDIPIYVALDSADVWVNGDQFQLDEHRRPTRVAGVPPDCFSTTGQLWGNPLYAWDKMEQDDFAWWKHRMRCSARLYDIVRIDHFIGIAHYYSIPAQDSTAQNGVWVKGPGEKLIAAIAEAMAGGRIIAENLGTVTPEVDKMLRKSGYPGMRVIQFGFDSDSTNEHLPCHYEKNSVIYGGTHDNETLAGFFEHQPPKLRRFARAYLGVGTTRELPWGIIRAGYASVANTAVFQLQDLLCLDNRARINTPSTIGGNWCWRLQEDQLSGELAQKLKKLALLYDRCSEQKEKEKA